MWAPYLRDFHTYGALWFGAGPINKVLREKISDIWRSDEPSLLVSV